MILPTCLSIVWPFLMHLARSRVQSNPWAIPGNEWSMSRTIRVPAAASPPHLFHPPTPTFYLTRSHIQGPCTPDTPSAPVFIHTQAQEHS